MQSVRQSYKRAYRPKLVFLARLGYLLPRVFAWAGLVLRFHLASCCLAFFFFYAAGTACASRELAFFLHHNYRVRPYLRRTRGVTYRAGSVKVPS